VTPTGTNVRTRKAALVQHLKDEQIPASVGLGGPSLLIVRTVNAEDVQRVPKEWQGVTVVARQLSR
jgi:hypothetical protein